MNGNKVYLQKPEIIGIKNYLFYTICSTICQGEGVELDDLKMPARWIEILYPRQLIMYFTYKKGIASLSTIGRFFHKNHATVIHACKVIQNYYDTDKYKHKIIDSYNKKFNEIMELLEMDLFKKYENYETDKV